MKRWICYVIYGLTVICAFYTVAQGMWLNFLYAIISLVLYWIIESGTKRLHLELSDFLKTFMTIFIFMAIILGSICHYYSRYPWWDSMLHGITGFVMAAIGLRLPELFNVDVSKSRLFRCLSALAFSMMIGVFWEFYEYSADHLLKMNAQKDSLITTLTSDYIYDENLPYPQTITEIEKTVIYHDNGRTAVIEGGMLDVGLTDTMKDQAVHLFGSFLFLMLCLWTMKHPNQWSLAKQMMIKRSK